MNEEHPDQCVPHEMLVFEGNIIDAAVESIMHTDFSVLGSDRGTEQGGIKIVPPYLFLEERKMIRKIPPETDSFHFYNANPKGLRTGDCVVRAVAVATNNTWDNVLKNLTTVALTTKHMTNSTETFNDYLIAIGWVKMPCPKKCGTNRRFTGEEFSAILRKHNLNFTFVANIGGNHTVCIKDGKVWDTWDSTDGCIGNVWVHANNTDIYRQIISQY